MDYENICFATEGNIALVTLNRPQRRNALSLAHPYYRDHLERQAFEHRLIPHGVSF
jgi:1,4-dihydroxy-2-naphthoyl-CoA synthase